MLEDNTVADSKDKNGKEKLILKAKVLDLNAEADIVILNAKYSARHNIFPPARIIVGTRSGGVAAVVDTSNAMVGFKEIGLFKSFAQKHGLKSGDVIMISPLAHPKSVDIIKKKITNVELNEEELKVIVDDIMDNKIGEVEISAFVTALYAYQMTDNETIGMINAILGTGNMLNLGVEPVVDKHCIGGVAGNRTTMVIVPIIAAAGAYIPKTSSRSITSASGTADTMEAIANVSFSISEMEEIVKKAKGCVVWGGALNLAAADDKLIKIRHPLRLDPEGLLLASILAKKKSVKAQHLLIDIPVGNGAKIAEHRAATKLAERFRKLGNALGMNTATYVSDGSAPVGKGVGPVLECIDVLKVLQNSKDASQQLMHKSCVLAGKLLEMAGKANAGHGFMVAEKIVSSGKALAKFREIVELQGGNPKVKSSELRVGKNTATVHAKTDGIVMYMDNRVVSKIARIAGAPDDKEAGVLLYATSGSSLKKGQAFMEIFSNSETRLSEALKYAEEAEIVGVRNFVIEV